MKISEMSAEKGFETMARIAPYVAELLRAGDIKEAKEKLPETFNGVDVFECIYPALAGGHASAIIHMAAIMTDVPYEEMAKKNAGEVAKAIGGETLREFFDFFPFARGLALRV